MTTDHEKLAADLHALAREIKSDDPGGALEVRQKMHNIADGIKLAGVRAEDAKRDPDASPRDHGRLWDIARTILDIGEQAPEEYVLRREAYLALHRFLERRARSDGGGWADLNDEDMQLCNNMLIAVMEAKCEPDADGDPSLELHAVNLSRTDGLRYAALPHLAYLTSMPQRLRWSYLQAAVNNVFVAQSGLRRLIDDMDSIARKEAATPKPDSIRGQVQALMTQLKRERDEAQRIGKTVVDFADKRASYAAEEAYGKVIDRLQRLIGEVADV